MGRYYRDDEEFDLAQSAREEWRAAVEAERIVKAGGHPPHTPMGEHFYQRCTHCTGCLWCGKERSEHTESER